LEAKYAYSALVDTPTARAIAGTDALRDPTAANWSIAAARIAARVRAPLPAAGAVIVDM
jgi:hypothetical protein